MRADLAELVRGAFSLLTVVRRVLVVGEVKADVVLAHGRRDERVLGVERLHHEGLDPKGCEGAADRVEHDVDGRRLGVAALAHGVEEVVGLDVRRFLAILGRVHADDVGDQQTTGRRRWW